MRQYIDVSIYILYVYIYIPNYTHIFPYIPIGKNTNLGFLAVKVMSAK